MKVLRVNGLRRRVTLRRWKSVSEQVLLRQELKDGHDDMTMSAGKIGRRTTRLGGGGCAVRNKIRNGVELCPG